MEDETQVQDVRVFDPEEKTGCFASSRGTITSVLTGSRRLTKLQFTPDSRLRFNTLLSAMLDTTGCVNNTIITASGKYFDYDNPTIRQIDIEDIAIALGNTCRFGGHCRFYSVAEHCFHCCEIAWSQEPENVPFQMLALMHDAAEAYIGDMPKPLKNIMPEFRDLENAIEAVIDARFDLDQSHKDKVKYIDLCMLKAEKRHLFPDDQLTWQGFGELPDIEPDIMCWSPDESAKRFIEAFEATTARGR